MQKQHNILKTALLYLLTLFGLSCANIVAPSGGPRDINAPVLKKSEPLVFSRNVHEKKIALTFSEFIVLKNQADQIVVSPPMKELPEFNIRGKKLIIQLPDSLSKNTTYNISFGEALMDNNEGNILSGFSYVFATGDILDSMSICGKLTDAFTLEPVKEMFVMLYQNPSDSAPVNSLPLYVTKSAADGSFCLNNITFGSYYVFALSDKNNDMLFNQPAESIAFADSMIASYHIPKPDTSKIQSDSLEIVETTVPVPFPLRVFLQADTVQKLLRARSDMYGQIQLVYRQAADKLNFYDAAGNELKNNMLFENVPTRDTVLIWLREPVPDTLFFIAENPGFSSDTLNISIKKKPVTSKGKGSGKGTADAQAGFSLNIYSNVGGPVALPYYQMLEIKLNHPLESMDTSKLMLFEKQDSILTRIFPEMFFHDSIVKRQLSIAFPWNTKSEYLLTVYPSAFTDIYGLKNDTSIIAFKISPPENFGNLKLTLKPQLSAQQFVVQLLGENKAIVQQAISSGDKALLFEHLPPGNYTIRIIHDKNRNGKWDTGDYFRKTQPEKVFIIPAVINIRANWDSEYEYIF